MPRLPTARDLGNVALRPSTGTTSVDTSILSAPSRATAQLGQVVSGALTQEYQDQQRLDFGKAQTAWLQGQAEAHAALERDNDYATMQDRYGQQMQKVTESSSSGITSGRMRQEFDNWVNQQNIRGSEQIRTLAWSKEKDASIAGLNQSLETSRSTYLSSTDPETRQQILDATNNMIQGAASKGYIDQTQAQQLGQRWITDAATGSLKMMQPEQRLSALRNPQGITTFLPPDQRQAMIKDAAQEAISTRVGQWQVQASTGNAGMNTLAVPHDTLMQAVYQQESGNRHLNADGSIVQGPVTKSGDRAQGVGQIMPATGRDPGFGIKPLQNDSEEENRRVSGELMDALTKRYNGNQVLALAAYNAGFGKVDNWIKQIGDPRTGQVSNEQFAASIPVNETRNYVYAISANAQRMGNVRSIIDSQDFKDMDGQQQAQMTSKILQVQDQVNSANWFHVQQQMKDTAAMAEAGQDVVSPVTEADFISNMPTISTPGERAQYYQQWNQYKQVIALQPINQAIINGSPEVGLQAVNSINPSTGEADFSFKRELHNRALQNFNNITARKQSDPIQFAISQQKIDALDMTSVQSISDGLRTRQQEAAYISSSYKTPPALFSKAEAAKLSITLSQSTPETAISLLQGIGRSVSPVGLSVFQSQLGENNPTYGAVAGILATPDNYKNTKTGVGSYITYPLTVDKYNASDRIIRGYRALNPSKEDKAAGVTPITIPSDQKMEDAFNERVGDSFLMSAQERQKAYNLFKSAYAGEMLFSPEVKSDDRSEASRGISDSIANKAILYATGGVVSYGGSEVVAPYGMGDDAFKEKMDSARAEAFKGMGSYSNFSPVKLPSGRYGFRVGNRLATKDGQLLTVEIN